MEEDKKQDEEVKSTAIGTAAIAASCQWCNQATAGSRLTIIGIEDYRWQVHKCLLVRRSSYFNHHLSDGDDGDEHLLPSSFPGGAAALDAIVSYCLDPAAQVLRASNVAAVRCAAEFLGMARSSDVQALPLSRRADEFLVHVALRCWGGALAVLSQCARLLPLAEELGIVARCIDAIARAVASSPSRSAAEIGFLDDLAAAVTTAPPAFLAQIVGALRSKGVREASIARLLVACVQRWLFSPSASSSEAKLLLASPPTLRPSTERLEFVEAIAGVLPYDDSMPVAFLFLLLRYALTVGASDECKFHLESRISLQLHKASLDDLLLPIRPTTNSESIELQLGSLTRIMSRFFGQQRKLVQEQQQEVLSMAKSWDELLVEVSCDSRISVTLFSQLIEALPTNARTNHDMLYKALQSFFRAHPEINQQERTSLCQSLNCLKLSQEVCIQAVQNEMMPLRMVVQAMFVQQLETRNAIARHLRAMTNVARLRPIKAQLNQIQEQGVRMKLNVAYEGGACTGGCGDSAASECLVEDLQETSLRLETLEAAMCEMKSSLWNAASLNDEDCEVEEDHKHAENEEAITRYAENGEDNNVNENNSEENNGSCLSSNSTPTSQKVQNVGEDETTKHQQQEEQTTRLTKTTTKKKRRFFGGSGRNGAATRRGVATRMLNRIGILGLCKASSRNLAVDSFNELPLTTNSDKHIGGRTRMTTGCLSSSMEQKVAGTAGAATTATRRNKAASSWDDGQKGAVGAAKVHARHHSVA